MNSHEHSNSDHCINKLKSQWKKDGMESPDDEWVEKGAGQSEGNFSTFNKTDGMIIIDDVILRKNRAGA